MVADSNVVGGTGRKAGEICIGEHYLGCEIAAVIRRRGVAAKQGFLMYYNYILRAMQSGPR